MPLPWVGSSNPGVGPVQFGAGTTPGGWPDPPAAAAPVGRCTCGVSALCTSGEHGSRARLPLLPEPAVSTVSYWHLQPLPQAAWAEDKVLHGAQDRDAGNRQQHRVIPLCPSLPAQWFSLPAPSTAAPQDHIKGGQCAPAHPGEVHIHFCTRPDSSLGPAQPLCPLVCSQIQEGLAGSWPCPAPPGLAFQTPGWASGRPQPTRDRTPGREGVPQHRQPPGDPASCNARPVEM